MEELDRLKRALGKVKAFGEFEASQRPYWLELRQAVQYFLRRSRNDEHAGLTAAYRGVHDMPELQPREGERWHLLRDEVCAALRADG
ncbi:hypothetical protein AAG607_13540 [Citromicrobium bathyomarinum]|uniref:hypothetical protein n=1 Tax=Citromicrobium bathyomarinum TaxID=72174 RepID=UPI003159FCF1